MRPRTLESEQSLPATSTQRTAFNRPPRIRPSLPTESVQLPKLPNNGRQGRGWTILSSFITSGALIGASVFVSRTRGSSSLYLIPMVVGATAFLLIAIIQFIQDMISRWRESKKYQAALKTTILRLIQLYTDQQYIRYRLDPQLTQAATTILCEQCDTEQSLLINQYVRKSFLQRVLRRSFPPEHYGLVSFSERWRNTPHPIRSLLDIIGCDNDNPAFAYPKPRLWERRPHDPDFLQLQIGTGLQNASIKVEAPSRNEQPFLIDEIIQRFSVIHNVPITFSLRDIGSLGIAGSRTMTVPLTHALIWQIVTHQSPSEVRLAIISDNRAYKHDWQWLYWLRHSFPINGDQRRRMMALSEDQVPQLELLLIDELSRRSEQVDNDIVPIQIILLIDGNEGLYQKTVIKELLHRGSQVGIYVIALAPSWEQVPSPCGAILRINQEGIAELAPAGGEWSKPIHALQADIQRNEVLSRTLRRLTLAETGGNKEIPRSVRLYALLQKRAQRLIDPDIGDELCLSQQWSLPINGAWHTDVPIGAAEGEVPLLLDLREHEDGPHGIIAGKTGAGKSELLQAIITAIAATHAPDRAQFMLIDFKAGASLRIFADLPHTVGLVTDLQDGRLANRAITAMKSEIRRRKDILDKADVQNISEYRKLSSIPKPKPLANLLIVIDEFDSMVKEQPNFVDELITVVKQGRSLGVHLLLATQQPSSAVKDDIKTQLQYWIALRLGSVNDSREMLQRPDAFFLPSDVPGRAYKRVGTELRLFQAARVSIPFQSEGDEGIIWADGINLIDQTNQTVEVDEQGRAIRDIDVILRHVKHAGTHYKTPQIWCPPLPSRMILSQELYGNLQILPKEVIESLHRGQYWTNKSTHLLIPFGLVDIPQESIQREAVLNLMLGHVFILGAPGSGKTMLLRTLLFSLAATHSPSRIWCYVIDAGGRGLGVFRTMPHVGGIAHVRDVDEVRRTIWIIKGELDKREKAQRQQIAVDTTEINSETHNTSIILIIDKFALFRGEYEETPLFDDLLAIASQGKAYGIHLILTADRPIDVPYRLQGLLDTRYLLRLTDEGDSSGIMGKRDASYIAIDSPGRGFLLSHDQGWVEFQTALPYIETLDEIKKNMNLHESFTDEEKLKRQRQSKTEMVNNLMDTEVITKLQNWIAVFNTAWNPTPDKKIVSAPVVQVLPDSLAFIDMWQQVKDDKVSADNGLEVCFGLEAQTLGVARFFLSPSAPSIFVVGGKQSGKTITLRSMLRSIALRYSKDMVTFILIDPRRNSFKNLPIEPHKPHYITNEADLLPIAQDLERKLEEDFNHHYIICIDDFEVGQSVYSTQFQKPYNTNSPKTFMGILERIMNLGAERGFSCIVSANTSNPSGFLSQINNISRQGIILQPHTFPSATNLLGVRLPIRLSGKQGLVGRGFMVSNNQQQWTQIAYEEDL